MTLWFDRSRLAELAADADTPGQDLLRDYLVTDTGNKSAPSNTKAAR